MAITFHTSGAKLPLIKKAALKSFIAAEALKAGKRKLSIAYIFCSDDFLLGINQQFLGHDYYTDIITFSLGETEVEIEAEIYISLDRVKDNAQRFKVGLEEELYRVIFHGVLHLLGYKDKTARDKETMRSKENEWLRGFKRALQPNKAINSKTGSKKNKN